jgi:2',3'-cyclic-nucleotide 2'-phosphodiesterase (5'-nucleotidase family)
MNFKRSEIITAVMMLAALATPATAAAQQSQSQKISQNPALRNAEITILQTTDVHHHANGVNHVGLDVNGWMARARRAPTPEFQLM